MDPAQPFSSRLLPDERAMIRKIGSALIQVLQGRPAILSESSRPDELGLLAGMVNRVTAEVLKARKRDQQAQQAIQDQLAALQQAHRVQADLLDRIMELSTPVLHIHPRVLLIPLIGTVDRDRGELIATTMLNQVANKQARVVILDISSAKVDSPFLTDAICRAAAAAGLLGARTILSGASAQFAKLTTQRQANLSSVITCSDLHAALTAAIQSLAAKSLR